VLRHMGTDLNAADRWLAYVNFLKTAPVRHVCLTSMQGTAGNADGV
jgi:hypothetical protein